MQLKRLISTFKEKIVQGDLNDTISHIQNYFLSTFGTKVLAFISIPILTRLLSPEEYGLLNIIGTYTLIISVLFTFNVHSSIVRYYNYNPVSRL